MAKSYQQWRASVIGQRIDLDNQSYDCVDVSKHWAEYLTGKGWQTSLAWGNAKDLWHNVPGTYWNKIPRGNRPQVGDVVCMSGAVGGGYGHTGVVDQVDGGNIRILQQNTFTQQAVYTGIWSWNADYIQGFLRPKTPFAEGAATLEPWQRVAADQVAYRKSPRRDGELIEWFKAGETYDFKGWVKGEAVDGNDKWFVGRYTAGHSWSGGYTDKSTNGLPDITPAKQLKATERQIGDDAMNYRRTPELKPDNVISVLQPGEVYEFDGWIHGQSVDGNDIWLRGKEHGGYVHVSGLTNKTVDGLPELVAQAPKPTQPTQPAEPAYTFQPDLPGVTQVIPAANGNFQRGNFPAKPTHAVLHDFGTLGHDTFNSTLNHFKAKSEVSAHFVVAQKHRVQMVSLKDRAYGSGAGGNNWVQIELDPLQDKDTIESGKQILRELRDYYGYKLQLIKHPDVPGNNTLCGDDIDLADYEIDEPAITPLPTDPVPTPGPINPPTPDQPLPPVEPVPVKPSTKTLEGILAIITNVVGVLTIFFSSLVLPEGTPAAVVQAVAFITVALTNINLAIQRTRLKQTAINQTAETTRQQ